MEKRGQFFLIAAFIIAGITLSLGTAYNSADTSSSNLRVSQIAEEIKYESSNLINNLYKSGLESKIDDNIVSLASNYSKSNPDLEILIIYGNQNALNARYFKNGVMSEDVDIQSTNEGRKIKAKKDNNYKEFNIVRGYNFFVAVTKEVGNEIYTSSK